MMYKTIIQEYSYQIKLWTRSIWYLFLTPVVEDWLEQKVFLKKQNNVHLYWQRCQGVLAGMGIHVLIFVSFHKAGWWSVLKNLVHKPLEECLRESIRTPVLPPAPGDYDGIGMLFCGGM